jgi:uroporphyrinogen-III synthase
MLALAGVGVLVTRPAQQAASLCHLLEAEGATTFPFPTVEIVPVPDLSELLARLQALVPFDLAIFASANAARLGGAILGLQPRLNVAAIGPATARALEHAGLPVSIPMNRAIDSEGLLRSLEPVTGQRVLIVKGTGGRDLLEHELLRRGASVAVAEVYRRARAHPATTEIVRLESRFARHEIQVVTATSVEIAESLFALVSPALRAELARAAWVVPSERVRGSVRALGAAHEPLLAASAEDQDLVAAIVRWRASESGA